MPNPIRDLARRRVNGVVHGGDLHLERYQGPPGDPGPIPSGPDSVAWRVHADLPGMITGGIAALLLQSLHPLAMAGVDQHSDYREQPVQRLNQTAGFVSVTTFGSTAAADRAIARVRGIHRRVHGEASDGRPYRADDPELLRWVHTAEVWSFLRGYETYTATPLTPAERDRYFAEAAGTARRLGAADVPTSAAEAAAYLDAMRPDLALTPAASAALEFLRRFGRTPLERAVFRLLFAGAVPLLPPWAAAQLGLRPSPAAVPAVRATLAPLLRWSVTPSAIVTTARARVRASAAPPTPEPPAPQPR